MRKVIFFTNGLVGIGGAERVLLEAVQYFQKKDVKVKILTFVLNKDALMAYKDKVNIDEIVSNSYFKRIVNLRKKLLQLQPDLIICQSSLDCMYVYLAGFGLNIPYISYIHGSLFWLENEYLKYAVIHKPVFTTIRNSVYGHKQFVPRKVVLPLQKRLFFDAAAIADYLAVRKAKKLIVLTKQIQWEVQQLYGRKAVVVRGCLDKKLLNYKKKTDIRKKYKIAAKTKIIMSIGRLDPRKRIDILVKAFLQLCEENIVLLIGGRGPDKERIEEIIQNSKHKDKIKMLGFVKDEEYFDHLAGCDIFAFPSWTTSGIPTYEALALGKKVIWTTEAEEPVLTHPNVYVAEPTVAAFVAAINKALNSSLHPKPDLREHTWEKYFGKLFLIAEKASR
ncbi:glycosyltransferase family 4 protein [Candidatus Woesearchaeota archaeon]|nr:glycosyltransferase family 4 protein [Candidatus Woesearchaeota archaeon]